MKQDIFVFLLTFLGTASTLNAEAVKTPEACSKIATLANSNKLSDFYLPGREPTQEERAELEKRGGGDSFSVVDVSSHLGREAFRYYRSFSRYGSCRNPILLHFDRPPQPKLSADQLAEKFERGPCGWEQIARIDGATYLLLYENDSHLYTSISLDGAVPDFCKYGASFEPDSSVICSIDSGDRHAKALWDIRKLSKDNPFAVHFDNADYYESIRSASLVQGQVAQILARREFSGRNGGSIREDYRLISHDGKVNDLLTNQLNELTSNILNLQDVYDQRDGSLLVFDNNPYMTKSVRVKLPHSGELASCETPMLRTLTVTRSGLVNW